MLFLLIIGVVGSHFVTSCRIVHGAVVISGYAYTDSKCTSVNPTSFSDLPLYHAECRNDKEQGSHSFYECLAE